MISEAMVIQHVVSEPQVFYRARESLWAKAQKEKKTLLKEGQALLAGLNTAPQTIEEYQQALERIEEILPDLKKKGGRLDILVDDFPAKDDGEMLKDGVYE